MHEFLWKEVIKILETPTETFRQLFEENGIIFSNILLLRLGKMISIAMQYMTKSPKKYQLTMFKHIKKFSFRLGKYYNVILRLYIRIRFNI